MKLDIKDQKILFELDKNSRMPLSQLAKKVRLSKEVVFHRLNNLVKRGVILRFQTIISSYRLGYTSYKIYFKLQNMTEKVRKEMEDFFLKDDMVYWVGQCQGQWDFMIAYWSKSIQDFSEFEDAILNRFSNYILDKEVSITRMTVQYNRRWFYHDKPEPIETTFGQQSPEIELDNIDIEVLKHLANNARMKITDLAQKLKVSVTVAGYRLKQLEKKKVILGYKYALNPKLLDYETCKAFIAFKDITAEKRNKLINYCKMNPNIINIVLTIGSWDMEIELEVKNFEEYYKIMNDIQERFNDIIKSYDSVLFSSEPKQSFVPGAYPKIMIK